MSDIFGRNYSYQKVALDNSFPRYILENKEKYSEWIL